MSTLAGLIETLRNSLREGVAPELVSDAAHSQFAGVIDVLDKLQGMAVWSPALLRERIAVLEAGCAAVVQRALSAGVAPPVDPAPALPPQATQAQLEEALRNAERRVARLTDWLFEPGADAAPAPALRRELDLLVRATLRDALAVEKRLTPRADLSGMTRASEEDVDSGARPG
ncbi:hypothetical protein [Caenimonas aquaedulcis]|uniref:Uncharacterized protein n=1 Tax=Caenimonas aquaedulcis TaxID=2793270 RepID=A0A931H3X2_9BURK|nr:hypothetical protein [Caenimonas aquaedulcis]MBG9388057.1 hypothetical protein [Caenimonas aquaedulcis]